MTVFLTGSGGIPLYEYRQAATPDNHSKNRVNTDTGYRFLPDFSEDFIKVVVLRGAGFRTSGYPIDWRRRM